MNTVYACVEKRETNTSQWESVETFNYPSCENKERSVLFPLVFQSELDFEQVIPSRHYGEPDSMSSGCTQYFEGTTWRDNMNKRFFSLTFSEYSNIGLNTPSKRIALKCTTRNESEIIVLPVRESYLFSLTDDQMNRVKHGEWVQYSGGEVLLDDMIESQGVNQENVYLNAIFAGELLWNTREVFNKMGEIVITHDKQPDNVRACVWVS